MAYIQPGIGEGLWGACRTERRKSGHKKNMPVPSGRIHAPGFPGQWPRLLVDLPTPEGNPAKYSRGGTTALKSRGYPRQRPSIRGCPSVSAHPVPKDVSQRRSGTIRPNAHCGPGNGFSKYEEGEPGREHGVRTRTRARRSPRGCSERCAEEG